MSASDKNRRDNLYLALRLMMQDLGEPYEWQEHDAKTPKFTAVYPTTWDELTERGLVKARSFDRYRLTGPGWIAGLKQTGKFAAPEFKQKAGRLEAALKARVKPGNREQCGTASRTELARETGLSELFIYDAIDSHLLRELFGVIDAHWSNGDIMKTSIDIPRRFGLNALDDE
ncbi:MAG TPA: hypothetical protein PKJ41_03100 [Bryobacteraceae bacterium]|nr:hypothetical protein [Bryobacteraceae bacterium]HPT28470.1 hypothetical protein [Bryobacteraceae bacterium]